MPFKSREILIKLISLGIFLFSINANSLGTREEFPLAVVGTAPNTTTQAIETKLNNLATDCKAFEILEVIGEEDSPINEFGSQYYESAKVGGITSPFPYIVLADNWVVLGATGEIISQTDAINHKTWGEKFDYQPYPEYQRLIQQNQICELSENIKLFETSLVEEILPEEESMVDELIMEIQKIDLVFKKKVLGDIFLSNEINYTDLSEYDSIASVELSLSENTESVFGFTNFLCEVVRDRTNEPAEIDLEEAKADLLDKAFNINSNGLPSEVLEKIYNLVRNDVPAEAAEKQEWIDYCKPRIIIPPMAQPEGKGGDSALTLYALGYENIPQTRRDGIHIEEEVESSPYSIGIISTLEEVYETENDDIKTHFAVLKNNAPGFLSTGIQNSPKNEVGKNPHKFFYEEKNEEFINLIKQKIKEDIGNNINSVEYARSMGNESSNPFVLGYALKDTHGSGANDLPMSASSLSSILSSTEYIKSSEISGNADGGDWGNSPFKTKLNLPASGEKIKTILELYNEGFNWDNKACVSTGDQQCKFAISVSFTGAGCGGFFFKNSMLSPARLDSEKSNILRNNGAGWFPQDYIKYRANGPLPCDLGDNQRIKADLYYNLTYNEMSGESLSYYLDDLGALLKPGFFFSNTPTSIGDISLSQMKMARYQKGDTVGIKTNVIISENQIEEKYKYQQTAEYCTELGMSSVEEDGQIFCTASACPADLTLDQDSGMCIREGADPCPEPVFTVEDLRVKEGSIVQTIDSGRCIQTYEVEPIVHSGYFTNEGIEIPYDSTGNSYSGGTATAENFRAAGLYTDQGIAQENSSQIGYFEVDSNLWRQGSKKANGDWRIDGTGVKQFENGNPTFYLKNSIYGYGTYEGTAEVQTTTDDDWFGIVFGYKSYEADLSPATTIAEISSNKLLDTDSTFYKISWKQSTQNSAYNGFDFQRIVNYNGSGISWKTDATANSSIQKFIAFNGEAGWLDNTKYTMKLNLKKDRVIFSIKKVNDANFTEIFNIEATKELYDRGIVEKEENTENYFFSPGRFGFYNYSQELVKYDQFRITDYTEIKCDPTHISLTDRYGLPSGKCMEVKSLSCPADSGLDIFANNGSVGCGKKVETCSLADLEQTIDPVTGKITFGNCKFPAIEETSIDVLKDITSRIFYNKFYKNSGSMGLIRPIDLEGVEVPEELVERLSDELNWQIDDDGYYSKLNNILSRSESVITSRELGHLVSTYELNATSREDFQTATGIEKDKLPNFQVDVLGLTMKIEVREQNDIHISGSVGSSGPGIENSILGCYESETEVYRFPDIEGEMPVKIVCASIIPQINGLWKYKWNPFENEKSVAFTVKSEGESKLLLEGVQTLQSIIPEEENFNIGGTKEEQRTVLLNYISSERNDDDSIIKSSLICQDYEVEIYQTMLISEGKGTTTGLLTCKRQILEGFSSSSTSPFISEGISKFNEELSQSPPVISKIGKLKANPLIETCISDVTGNTMNGIYKVGLIEDQISKQEYETPISLSTNPTIYIPFKSSAEYIKNEEVRKEIIKHISYYVGDVSFGPDNLLVKEDGLVRILNNTGYKRSQLRGYLTEQGASNLAEQISRAVKGSYPYLKEKIEIVIPKADFKDDADISQINHSFFILTTTIDNDTYMETTGGEAGIEKHIDPIRTDVVYPESQDQETNGYILANEILNNKSNLIGKYTITNGIVGTDFVKYERNNNRKKIVENEAFLPQIIDETCNYLIPMDTELDPFVLGYFEEAENVKPNATNNPNPSYELEDFFWGGGEQEIKTYAEETNLSSFSEYIAISPYTKVIKITYTGASELEVYIDGEKHILTPFMPFIPVKPDSRIDLTFYLDVAANPDLVINDFKIESNVAEPKVYSFDRYKITERNEDGTYKYPNFYFKKDGLYFGTQEAAPEDSLHFSELSDTELRIDVDYERYLELSDNEREKCGLIYGELLEHPTIANEKIIETRIFEKDGFIEYKYPSITRIRFDRFQTIKELLLSPSDYDSSVISNFSKLNCNEEALTFSEGDIRCDRNNEKTVGFNKLAIYNILNNKVEALFEIPAPSSTISLNQLKEENIEESETYKFNSNNWLLENVTGSSTQSTFPKSCYEIKQDNMDSESGKYTIRVGSVEKEVLCDMETDGGGWTLAMRDLSKFDYNSPYWEHNLVYKERENIESGNYKSDVFNKTSVKEIMLKTDWSNEDIRISVDSPNLSELFKGDYLATSLGRDKWKTLIEGSSLQLNCNKEGINVEAEYGMSQAVRIGILSNEQDECKTPDSYLGMGMLNYTSSGNFTGGDESNNYHGSDNGGVAIAVKAELWIRDTNPPPTPFPLVVVTPSSCLDLKKLNPEAETGIHSVTIAGVTKELYCDMESDGGGWTAVASFNPDKRAFKPGISGLNWETELPIEQVKAIQANNNSYYNDKNRNCYEYKINNPLENGIKDIKFYYDVDGVSQSGYQRCDLDTEEGGWNLVMRNQGTFDNSNPLWSNSETFEENNYKEEDQSYKSAYYDLITTKEILLSGIIQSPTSCKGVLELNPNAQTGIHEITKSGITSSVYCDMETAGGGWTAVASITNGPGIMRMNADGLDLSVLPEEQENSIKQNRYSAGGNYNETTYGTGTYHDRNESCWEYKVNDPSLSGTAVKKSVRDPETGESSYQVCDFDTDGGGWTLALRDNNDMGYDHESWTNGLPLHEETNYLEGTYKSKLFDTSPIKEILVKGEQSPRPFIIQKEASSLGSIFNGGYVATNKGRQNYKDLINSSSLQQNCNKEGFNISIQGKKVRLGIISNEQDDCLTPDSSIGLGMAGAFEYTPGVSGLIGKKYNGYFADNLNWFDTAIEVSDSRYSNNFTTIDRFTPGENYGDNYSAKYSGYFLATTTGIHNFETYSDDSSWLWLGNEGEDISSLEARNSSSNELVDNSGTHSMSRKSGSKTLEAGKYYPILIYFGENIGDDRIDVSFDYPGQSKTSNGINHYYAQKPITTTSSLHTGNYAYHGADNGDISRAVPMEIWIRDKSLYQGPSTNGITAEEEALIKSRYNDVEIASDYDVTKLKTQDFFTPEYKDLKTKEIMFRDKEGRWATYDLDINEEMSIEKYYQLIKGDTPVTHKLPIKEHSTNISASNNSCSNLSLTMDSADLDGLPNWIGGGTWAGMSYGPSWSGRQNQACDNDDEVGHIINGRIGAQWDGAFITIEKEINGETVYEQNAVWGTSPRSDYILWYVRESGTGIEENIFDKRVIDIPETKLKTLFSPMTEIGQLLVSFIELEIWIRDKSYEGPSTRGVTLEEATLIKSRYNEANLVGTVNSLKTNGTILDEYKTLKTREIMFKDKEGKWTSYVLDVEEEMSIEEYYQYIREDQFLSHQLPIKRFGGGVTEEANSCGTLELSMDSADDDGQNRVFTGENNWGSSNYGPAYTGKSNSACYYDDEVGHLINRKVGAQWSGEYNSNGYPIWNSPSDYVIWYVRERNNENEVVRDPSQGLPEVTRSLSSLYGDLDSILKSGSNLRLKLYPKDMAKIRGENDGQRGTINFNLIEGSETVDVQVSLAITDARDLCLSVSNFSSEVAENIAEKQKFYSILKNNIDSERVTQILYNSANDVRNGATGKFGISNKPRDEETSQYWFFGWRGTSSGDVQARLLAKMSAEDALVEYISEKCSETTSLFSTTTIGESDFCSIANEFFLNTYNPEPYEASGITFDIPAYKDLFVSSGIYSNLEGYGSSRISALVKGRIGKASAFVYKEYYYQINGYENIAAQIKRGVDKHEFEFIKQASGSVDLEFLEKCVSNLGSQGYSNIENSNFSYRKVFKSGKKLLRNLIPETLNLEVEDYNSFYPTSATRYPIKSKLNSITGLLPKREFSLNIYGTLNEESGNGFCNNILPKTTLVGHEIFNDEFNRKVIEGVTVDSDLNGKLIIRSNRVFEGNSFLDTKGSPNWLQDKVCKSGYKNIALQMSKSIVQEKGTDICDGSLNSANCAKDPYVRPGFFTMLLYPNKTQRKVDRWNDDLIVSRATVCDYYTVERPGDAELATPTNFRDKVIVFIEEGSSELKYGKETDVLLNKNEVDKAKLNMQILDMPEIDRSLVINSINILSSIVNKKTGNTRSIPGNSGDDLQEPKMSISSENPIEQLVEKCMEFKSKVNLRKAEEFGGYEHLYDKSLIKEYPNQDKDYTFIDPRTEKSRAVRYCSDIFIETDQTYKKELEASDETLKREYLKGFRDGGSIDGRLEVEDREIDFSLLKQDIANMKMDGGYTYSRDPKTGQLVAKIGKDKERGTSNLKVTDMENSIISVPEPGDDDLQRDLIRTASNGSPVTAIAGIAIGITVVKKLMDFAEYIPAASHLITPALKKNVKMVEKGVKVVAGLYALSVLLDTIGSTQSADMDKMSSSQTSLEDSGVIGYISESELDTEMSDSQLVDEVMLFDKKLKSGFKEPKRENQYEEDRQKAKDLLGSDGIADDLNRKINDLDRRYDILKTEQDAYLLDSGWDVDDYYSNLKNKQERAGNNNELKFRRTSDFYDKIDNPSYEGNYYKELTPRANDLAHDIFSTDRDPSDTAEIGKTGRINERNIENSYGAFDKLTEGDDVDIKAIMDKGSKDLVNQRRESSGLYTEEVLKIKIKR
jgi:hypothetical protein